MKNCLICQTGQDQVALNRIPVAVQGAAWGDILVCVNCMEMLGPMQVKDVVTLAIQEKSYEPNHVFLADEKEEADQPQASSFELPVSAALLRDPEAFARMVGEKVGARLWEMHRGGPSDTVWTSSLSPDGETGFVLAVAYAPATLETKG